MDAALPLGAALPPLQSDGHGDGFSSRGTGAATPARPPQPLDIFVPAQTRVVAVTGGDRNPLPVGACALAPNFR